MGGKSKSSTKSEQADNRTVGTEGAIVAGKDGTVTITTTDSGVLEFGSEAIDQVFGFAEKALDGAISQSTSATEAGEQATLAALSSLDQSGDDFSQTALKWGLSSILLAGVAYGVLKK